MDESLRNLLLKANEKYHSEGFVVLGIFGSRARGDNRPDSDLDILYKLEDRFYNLYPGWNFAGRLEDIKAELSIELSLKVDFANVDALHEVGKKYILPETVYVA